MAILDALQLEKESLLGQVQALNHRLVEERSKADSLSEQIRKLNIKHNRLEFKYSKKFSESGLLVCVLLIDLFCTNRRIPKRAKQH